MRAAITPTWLWMVGMALSMALHGGGMAVISERAKQKAKAKREPIKVRVVEEKKEVVVEEPKQEEPPPPPPPPPPPKPKPKPTPKPKEVATNKPPPSNPTPQPPVEPIQGFKKDTLGPSTGPGIAVPVGNTVMTKDTGKRVETAPEITQDLSADAKLIAGSYTEPQYTDAALDANLEGRIAIDVYVDDTGKPTQAELRKKVGFGMDARLVAAVLSARFTPRKNRLGLPEAGWSDVTITLRLP